MKNRSSAFQLPPDARTYIQAILERCNQLILCGVWGDLDILRLNAWLNNFQTEPERYFAACVLDNLIYRSKKQTIAMLEQLFQRVIPDLTRLDPTPIGSIDNLLQDLKKARPDPGVRLVAAVKRQDPRTKSANEIARFIKRYFGVSEKLIIDPSQIRACAQRGIKVFVFVDDFLGTGYQFSELLKEEMLDGSFMSSVYVVYSPLVCHQAGRTRLGGLVPKLRVRSVEELDDSHGLFNRMSPCFVDGCNTHTSAKAFYYQLLRKKGLRLRRQMGYGQLELAYAFEHATPNNSLPILWYDGNSDWTPLFCR
jgi:hypothetical protein